MNTLSVVVIGRNEGTQLIKCLESIHSLPKLELIYVDSASTDRSIENAQKFGAKIIEITSPTAAKARNAGWRAAQGDIILFLDADCELDKDFMEKAWKCLEDSHIAAVDGNIIEKDLEGSIYHRILSWEWNPSMSEMESFGGNVLIRKHVLQETGGFDSSLKSGEEPELSRRIRQKGYRLYHLSEPMVKHDAQMHSLKDYIQRAIRTGFSYAQISERFWHSSDPLWKKASLHNLSKTMTGLLLILFATALSFLYHSWIPLLGLLCIFTARILFKTYQLKDEKKSWLDCLLYALHCQFVQIPIFFGQLSYWLHKRREN